MNPSAKAEKVRLAHGQSGPKINVEAIAEAEGIAVVSRALDENTSGLIVKGADGTVTIGVNSAHHPNRRRFTIAHELGHYYLHNGGARMFVDKRDWRASAGVDRREIEANRFAAALLMPEPLLRAAVGSRILDAFENEAELSDLADRFGVSRQAITLRLKNLDLLFDASDAE